jgi:predicted proteasome-type protease
MSYCIAVSVDEGLVLTSDSRTNAGLIMTAHLEKCTSLLPRTTASWFC